ncbi:hypothetical protein JCM4814A_36710 [Streptomyces phaeofaciens JCM 4814]|uniref:Uncharacterized protein n=1 Tax=Streptomyces phaeofaciens TaxID=68254 RepID=A0A918HER3_9ACTN|nr:hypothetical protein GCM10010226_40850 [Streptomyces phaeofaciens]
MVPCPGVGLWFCSFQGAAVSLPRAWCWFVEKKQEVRTLMTVTVTGSARIQEFIVPTPVVSG